MFEKHFDDITATLASVNFDTTGLDFVNHGTNVGFDMPTITMYRYEDGNTKNCGQKGIIEIQKLSIQSREFFRIPVT